MQVRPLRVRAFAGAVLALVVLMAPAQADDAGPAIDPALVTDCLDAAGQGDGPAEACIGLAASACMEQPGGFSTYGMNQCLGQEYDLWDGLLNTRYREVMAGARQADAEIAGLGHTASEQAPALRDAQRRWIDWRDAACSYEYSRWGGGTGGGPAGTQCMLTLTARQVLWLDQYRITD